MNWLDLALIAVIAIGALMGAKIGVIRAALATAGVVAGTLLGGQLNGVIASLFSDLDSNSSIALVASYCIVITISLAAASVAAIVLRKIIYTLFLGWMDKLAGLALGIVAGAAIAAAVIMGMANLAYSSEVGDEVVVKVLDSTMGSEQAQRQLQDRLTGSKLVAVFMDTIDIVPASTMGLVPSSFRSALDVLDARRKILGN